MFRRIARYSYVREYRTVPPRIEQFHRDIEELAVSVAEELAVSVAKAPADIIKNTHIVSDMLDLASVASGNEIGRKLTLHRAKIKSRDGI